jgi:beta-lactamase superfamily II metal-dependent hydrolase
MTSEATVTILNVGHGNAAVVRDGGFTIVVDTGGEHAEEKLLAYLKAEGINQVDALLLSHSDEDHIGSAPTLLLSAEVAVKKVFLNSDSTKRTGAFKNLQLALQRARRLTGTEVETSLTSQQSRQVPTAGLNCEVLYPPPEFAVTGPGGTDDQGRLQTTNSLSAVVRFSSASGIRVLLPGDCSSETLEFWRAESVDPSANTVVFPHHGGRPGTSNPAMFARDFTASVGPGVVIFSISRAKSGFPRSDVLGAIQEIRPDTFLICTQLPDNLFTLAQTSPWLHHHGESGLINGLHVRVHMTDGGIQIVPSQDESK